MHLQNFYSQNPPWIWMRITIFTLSFTTHFILTRSDPRISEAGLFCGQVQQNSTFIPLFVRDMELLSQMVTANGSGQSQSFDSSSNVTIYTLAQCHGDLSHDDCLQCYAAARTRLPRCLPFIGRLFLDGCFLRYDIYPFFNESVSDLDTVNCNSSVGDLGGVGLQFGENVGVLIDNLTAAAVSEGGYAVRGSRNVFGLAECWNSVSREGCRACLAEASSNVSRCLPSREGRALNAGCYLRYSTERFYLNQTQTSRDSGISREGEILAILLSLVAFFMLTVFASYIAYKRSRKRKQERINLGQISFSYNKSNLNFKYEALEKATDYFDQSRKLGQGGAGSVYRGTLTSGKDVAVKRLFFSTRQWVDEFFNEVNLISGIEHKNLVKLLGCSIEGPESLLVYEFMPNRSLEQYLFEKNKIKILNWRERCNIIVGTAEGIAFLHGGSDVRIIHRDIKSSNVLLDENFDAKIADFGLARYFSADQTHLSTGIAGTLGYMAPEYIVKGQLTEKADVYSFGVLVLEIVCGRRNNAFIEDSGSLLQTVWMFYRTNKLADSVDPSLKGNFPAAEASKIVKIGLLCTQAAATERPSMAEVVRMLMEDNYEISEPNQPPFLNTNTLSVNSTRSPNSSLMSNTVTKFEVSFPSTNSSSIQSSDHGRHIKSEEQCLRGNHISTN